jgi:N utilization substance protein A
LTFGADFDRIKKVKNIFLLEVGLTRLLFKFMAKTTLTARTEFAAALNQICNERGISPESVLETIKSAILAAYRKDIGFDEEYQYEVEVDPDTGSAKIFRSKNEKKSKKEEVTPPGFGRIAAQTAKQVILQKIREAEKEAILDEYKDKIGEVINGMILRFEGKDIICDIGRGQAVMPTSEQLKTERYHLNKRLAVYIKDIKETKRGKQIIVSRTDGQLVVGLFKREVPEVSSGAVEIRVVAREPGSRSKVAVASKQSGVDPVGSCVGQKGVRVQAVIDELGGEKLDIIQYSQDPIKFITAALSPAENLKVTIDEKKKEAKVSAPEDQLSLAIGKEGQNVRLAAKLTGYKIDIIGPEGKKVKTEEEVKPEKKTKKTPALKKTNVQEEKKESKKKLTKKSE